MMRNRNQSRAFVVRRFNNWRRILAIGPLAFSFVAGARSDDTTSPVPASNATTSRAAASASQPSHDPELVRLVHSLGAPEFQTREKAQAALARKGSAAIPILIAHINDPNPEIAMRVVALLVRPEDTTLRIEMVVRLLETADPVLMEKAVYMLFRAPLDDYDPFVARMKTAHGRLRAIMMPVEEHLKRWRNTTQLFQARQARLKAEQRTDQAAKEARDHDESMYYEAEAAYWMAISAAEDYRPVADKEARPASRPAQPDKATPASGASKRAE